MKIAILILFACSYSFAQCSNSSFVANPEVSVFTNSVNQSEWNNAHSVSDSLLFKCQYENGLLTKSEYQDLLKAIADLGKMKKESMDYIVWQKRKQTFLDGMKKILGIKEESPTVYPNNNFRLQY